MIYLSGMLRVGEHYLLPRLTKQGFTVVRYMNWKETAYHSKQLKLGREYNKVYDALRINMWDTWEEGKALLELLEQYEENNPKDSLRSGFKP